MKGGDTSVAGGSEAILARILHAIDERGPGSVDVDALMAAHPDLAEEIRELLRMRGVLDDAGSGGGPAIPERLGEFRIVRRMARGGSCRAGVWRPRLVGAISRRPPSARRARLPNLRRDG